MPVPKNMKDDFGIGVGPYMSQLENLEKIRSKSEGHPGDFLHKIVSHG